MEEPVRLTREELYEQVWSEPMATLSKKYGLSDVGLAKICKRMKVPVPGRGYWRRKEVGQKVHQLPLRKLPANAGSNMTEVTLRQRDEREVAEELTGPIAQQQRYEAAPENEIVVAEMLNDPHPLVAKSVTALRRANRDSNGYLIPTRQPCLTVRVTLDSADRAMCIMDALLKALDQRGYTTSISDNEDHATEVLIGEERVSIALEERVDRVEKPSSVKRRERESWRYPEYDWVSSGKLALRIQHSYLGVRASWADGKQQRAEKCLNAFIVGLVAAAEALKDQRLKREAWQREWEEAERKRQEAQRLREEEEARVRALDAAMDSWHKCRLIRTYAAEMRTAAESTGVLADPALQDWLAWVESYAQSIDPFAPRPTVPADPGPPRNRYW